MIKNKKAVLSAFIISSLFLSNFLLGVVYAANTATVTATVTAQNISVTVDPSTVAYGVLPVDSSADTNPAGTMTVTNNGNVAEDITIKGENSANWTLDTTNVTADHYVHKFCATGCTSPPTGYTALTTSS